jgi:hypothetical protein
MINGDATLGRVTSLATVGLNLFLHFAEWGSLTPIALFPIG